MTTHEIAYPFLLVLSTLLNLVVAWTAIRANTRREERKPPIPEEMAKDYATKSELNSFRAEWDRTCWAKHSKLDDVVGKLFDLNREAEVRHGEWQRAVAAQLGRIESSIRGNQE